MPSVDNDRDSDPYLKPGLYKHFKGNLYRLYGPATHSETKEYLGIAYKSMKYKTCWVRPASMFSENVCRDGYDGPRFVRLPWYKQLLYFWKH